MTVTKTNLANLALVHLAVSSEIANVDTDNTPIARAFRRVYETTRDEVLRDFAWPFAKRTVELQLVEEDPTTEWAYSYRYPTDCLKARRLVSGSRNESRAQRIPYSIAGDDSGSLIYTDLEDAQLEYTMGVTDPARWMPDFVVALSLLLAHRIAPSTTGGDPAKLGRRALELFQFRIASAQNNALNEEQADIEPDSSLISSR